MPESIKKLYLGNKNEVERASKDKSNPLWSAYCRVLIGEAKREMLGGGNGTR